MHNSIILGTGRSGTSMVAATFGSTGVFMGEHLLQATPSNPFGYYEDLEVNNLNDSLIRRLVGTPLLGWRVRGKFFRTVETVKNAFFLAAPRKLRKIQPDTAQEERMRWFAQHVPFCYKDPRFSVTLPTWRPYLPQDTRYIVVFRDPMRTVASMLRDAQEQYVPPLPLTTENGYLYWSRTYSRLLSWSEGSPNWIFVNYDGMLDGSAFAGLSEFVGTTLDFSQIDRRTSRSASTHEWPASAIGQRCREVYERLCERCVKKK